MNCATAGASDGTVSEGALLAAVLLEMTLSVFCLLNDKEYHKTN